MNYIKSLIPKDKFDTSGIDELFLLNDDEIQPIIYDLLKWLQDYNWPVAKHVLPVIVLHQNAAMPHIAQILQEKDSLWICCIIEWVIPHLIDSNRQLVRDVLEILSSKKIENEDEEAVSEKASYCLSFYY